MPELLQYLVNGIIFGSIIALTAIGLTLVYGILNLPNFAHGDYLTLGAYLAFFFSAMGLNLLLAFFAAMIVASVMGVVIDKLVWRPMRDRKAGLITLLITSIGVAFVLRNLVRVGWGSELRTYGLMIKEGYSFLGIRITEIQLIIISVAFVLMFLVHYMLKYTKLGKAMRACSDNVDLARVSGIDVDKVITWTWVIAAALAAGGGILLGLDTHIRPVMGWNLLLPIFAAVILGGVGNPYGAMAGGMVIGLSQELSVILIPAHYKPAVAFAVIIFVLFLKPKGIFGGEG